jgi:PAS domain S-box-containing protein
MVFPGDGEMATLCRAFDWAQTPLGPVESWSQSLRTTCALVLASRNPMFLWWGPELVQVYNDAYRPSLGIDGRHPKALGAKGRESWPDIWEVIGPQIEQVMTTGVATWHEDQYLPIYRNGRLDDVWWTYSYSPVIDDDGTIQGTLVVCQETTTRIVAENERRRLLAERQQAGEQLRESEARLRAIFDGTNEYIGLLSPDGTVLEANRAALEFASNTRESVIGTLFWTGPWFAQTEGAPEQIRAAITQAARGELVRTEATLARPNGEELTFDISLRPIRDADGRVQFIVPEGRDITERHRTELALRASESRYRTLFDSLDEGFCVVEVIFDGDTAIDYRYVEANPAFIAQTGMPNPVGRRITELVPDIETYWMHTYGQVATTGIPIRFDAPSVPLNRWFDVYAFRIGSEAEPRVAILFTDVTAKVHAERERDRLLAELEIERSRLSEAFRLAPSFLAILRGKDHVFEFVNDAYYGVVGHRELIGLPLAEALPEVRDQGFVELLSSVLDSGAPYVGREVPITLARTADGKQETRYVDFIYQPLTESDGSRSGVVAHGSDVTEQVLARQRVERLLVESEAARLEAEQARAEAEAANRTKSEFLAIMSHELRTPLNAIGGYAELMELGIRGPVSPLQREDLRRLQASQRHLLGLINEVLNYAKLETGTVHYEFEPVRVREALVAAESLVAPQARAKGLRLTVHQCDEEVDAIADAEKLRQVLVNLLSNAVKFTDRGGDIAMSCAAVGDRIAIRVQDTGIGIPADKLSGIFDPFVQVRSDLNRPHEGTGLGLAISRDLARGMHGDLVVESTLGAGSTFTLTLPRASR